MGQLLLFVVVALVVAAIVFGVTVMVSGGDSGLTPVEPDGRSLALPSDRPLGEEDVFRARFDTAFRGYRMAQVDQAMQRAAYDIGYKGELIGVLEAEVIALREGRMADADVLRRAREAAIAPPPAELPVGSEASYGDQAASADPAPAHPASGHQASGYPAPGQSASVQPASAQSGPGRSGSAPPGPGRPPSGQVGPGQTALGKPGSAAAPARAAGDEEPAESR